MGNASSESVEIEPEAHLRIEQALREGVEGKAAGRRLFEHSFADEAPENACKRIGIRADGGGEMLDLLISCCNFVRDPQRCHHMDTPRSTQVAKFPEIHPIMMA